MFADFSGNSLKLSTVGQPSIRCNKGLLVCGSEQREEEEAEPNGDASSTMCIRPADDADLLGREKPAPPVPRRAL